MTNDKFTNKLLLVKRFAQAMQIVLALFALVLTYAVSDFWFDLTTMEENGIPFVSHSIEKLHIKNSQKCVCQCQVAPVKTVFNQNYLHDYFSLDIFKLNKTLMKY